jgi:hypothetical protein
VHTGPHHVASLGLHQIAAATTLREDGWNLHGPFVQGRPRRPVRPSIAGGRSTTRAGSRCSVAQSCGLTGWPSTSSMRRCTADCRWGGWG